MSGHSDQRAYISSYAASGWQCFPLRGKEPKPGTGWTKPYTGAWTEDDNIGVVLGKRSSGLVDLDLDWADARDAAAVILGTSQNKCFGRSSSPRSHMLFICPGIKRVTFDLPKSFLSLDVPDEHSLMVCELRGEGCYTMFPGSVHPSGETVEWENDVDTRHVSEERLVHGVGIVAFTAVCSRFWPGRGKRHDAALAFAGICKRAGVTEENAVQLLNFVVGQDEELNDRVRALRDVYISDKIPGWKSLENAFAFPPDARPVFAKWLGMTEALTAETYNDRYAVFRDGSKVRIGTLTPDPNLGRERWDLMNQTDFMLLERRSKAAADWLESPLRREYRYGFIFDPTGRTPEGFFNLWRGWAIEPVPGDWPTLRYHVSQVLCDGDDKHASYVLKWIAWMFQNPDKRAEVAIVFRGGKGTGKGVLGRALRTACGQHGLHISSSKMLVGDFNSHLRDCIFLFADEAFWAGDKQGEGSLKRLITEDTLMIEAKGRDAVQVRNMLHVLMASNEDWVVPTSIDERRYAVFDVSDRHRQDTGYFTSLVEALETELPAFVEHCLAVDLNGWHPRDDVPKTKALADQTHESEDPARALLRQCLETGLLPGTHPHYHQPNELMAQSFMSKLKSRAFGARVTDTAVGRLLGKIPGVTKDTNGRVFVSMGVSGPIFDRSRRYFMPPLPDVRKWFDPAADWGGTATEWEHSLEVAEVNDGPYAGGEGI